MTIDEIRDSIKDNLQNIDRLTKKLKIDIENAHKKKAHYDREIKQYRKIQSSPMAINGISFFFLWMELMDRVKRDQMQIQIANATYDISDLSALHQVAMERYQLIDQAKREGAELTDEAHKMLESDKIALLLDEKTKKIFAGDTDKAASFDGIFASFSEKLERMQRHKEEVIEE